MEKSSEEDKITGGVMKCLRKEDKLELLYLLNLVARKEEQQQSTGEEA